MNDDELEAWLRDALHRMRHDHCYLCLRTRDGAVRYVGWHGPVPHLFRVPLPRQVEGFSPHPMPPLPPRPEVREYELWNRVGKKTWEYRERAA